MKIILVILISAFLGIGAGYGAFVLIKPNLKDSQSAIVKSKDDTAKLNNDISQDIKTLSNSDYTSIKYLYDNDELTKEGAIAFLKVRAQIYDIKPEHTEKMIKNFERLTKKIPVIDAFKIIALQNQLLEFTDFTDPKLKGMLY
ncbi:MAG: hypothetical protein N2738_04440 [Thermodesulfovibrionales bacterium]|nr:hypothetical protein [Thermodesulfovibrionales bacterium]